MGLSDLIGALRANVVTFVIVIVLALVGAVVLFRAQGDSYEAAATLLVDAGDATADLATTEAIRTVWLPTIAEVVGSRGFRETVAARLGPDVDPEAVEIAGESGGLLLLRVVARAGEPQLAKRAADTAAQLIARERVSRGLTLSRVEQATLPTSKAGPGLLLYLIAGAALGLIGGILAALLVDAWRNPPSRSTIEREWSHAGPRAAQAAPLPQPSEAASPPPRPEVVAPSSAAVAVAAARVPEVPAAAPVLRAAPGDAIQNGAPLAARTTLVAPPPVLGEIPASDALAASGALQLRVPEPAVVAAFDELSRALERTAAGATVVAVAPVAGGDGASTVAAGLALTLAGRGVPVTVVDADLARPVAHEYLGVSNSAGLADLGRSATFGDVVRPTSSTSLAVIPAGTVNGRDAADAVAESLPALLDVLEGQVVLVDTPSPLAGRAGIVAAGVSGHVLLVSDAARLGTGAVDAAIDALAGSGADVLGVVVTHARQAGETR